MTVTAEVYANQPTGTVTAGGTTTSDTAFTVTANNAFPIASATPVPNTVFRIIDLAQPTEIMLVTTAPGGTGAGQSWTVARAQEGTAGVSHASNWTCVQVITAEELSDFKENSNAGSNILTIANTATETAIVQWQPPTNDQPALGVAYRGRVWGTMQTATTTTGTIVLTIYVRWGAAVSGTLIASLATTTATAALVTTMGNTGWIADVAVNCVDATHIAAVINFQAHKGTTQYTGVAVSGEGTNFAPVVISGAGPLTISAKWANAVSTNSLTCAGIIERTQ